MAMARVLPRRTGRWAVAWLGLVAVLAGGCAAESARQPPASQAAPSAESAPEPTTIEAAQAQLAQASATLAGLPGPRPPSAVTTPTVPEERSEQKTQSDYRSPASGEAAITACGDACKAMTSMKHAVDAICRLAGDADTRCTDARKTLADSAARTATCGC